MPNYKKRMNADLVWPIAEKIKKRFDEKGVTAVICGSLRRESETVGDIDIAVNYKPSQAKEIIQIPIDGIDIKFIGNLGEKGFNVLANGIQCNIYSYVDEDMGALILFLTGSKTFNIMLRGRAKKQGYKLNQYGLFYGDERIAGRTETQIFEVLGYCYVEPKDRQIYKFDYRILKKKGVQNV